MQPARKTSPFIIMVSALAFISSANCCNVAQCKMETNTGMFVLNCSSLGFSCVPSSIPNADIVNLSDNQITELKFDKSYAHIRELYLNNNPIRRYRSREDTFYELRDLEVLSMNNNHLYNSRQLRLHKLRELYLNHNNLVGLPEPNRWLEVLSADYNSLAGEIPLYLNIGSRFSLSCEHNQISKMVLSIQQQMTSTNISIKLGYNRITEFIIRGSRPTSSAFELFLQHNPLSTMSLAGLTPTVLNIDHTGVRDLKHQLNISQPELSVNRLYTRNNSMTTLIQPDWAWNLQYINADFNNLRYLTEETLQGFGELREIHMIGNRIAFISQIALRHLNELKSLYLDDNEITSLYGGIFLNQTNLITLSVTNNRISSLHPDDFTGLDSLVSLNLSSNRLFNLNSVAFRSIPTLNILDLSNNSLVSFDPGTCNDFPELQDLMLSRNQIDDISNLLQHCVSMETLKAEWNDIKTVSGAMIRPTLSRLELVGNPLHCDCRVASLQTWLLNHEPRQFPSCKDQQTSIILNETDNRYLACRAPKAESGTPSVVVNAGDNALLTCQISGSPAPTLSWLSPNGATLTNGVQDKFYIVRSTDLMIYSVGLDDAGNFTCLVVNDIGEQDSELVTLKVIAESVFPSVSKEALNGVFQTILGCVVTAVVVVFVAVTLYFCLIRRRQRKLEPSVNFKANPGEVSSVQIEIQGSGVAASKGQVVSDNKSVYQELLRDQAGSESRPQQPLPNEKATSLAVSETVPESDSNDYELPTMKPSPRSPSKIPLRGVYVNDSVARTRSGHPVHKSHKESLESIPGRASTEPKHTPVAEKRELHSYATQESYENKYEEI